MECTILVHIHTGAKGVSVQKKKHLHWKALDQTLNMDNELAFAAPTHNLLMRTSEEDSTRQALRNRWASLRASPQAARKKKRLSRLDMTILMNPETSCPDPAQGELLEDWQVGEFAAGTTTKPLGSFNPLVAHNKLTYVWEDPHRGLPQWEGHEGQCRAPKFLVDPLEGPSLRLCGRSWNLEHDPDFQH